MVEVIFSNTSFVLTLIYASTKFHFRKNLWNDLENFAQDLDNPWFVLGDFN